MSDPLRYILFTHLTAEPFGSGGILRPLSGQRVSNETSWSVGCVAVSNFEPVSGQYRQFIDLFIYFGASGLQALPLASLIPVSRTRWLSGYSRATVLANSGHWCLQ